MNVLCRRTLPITTHTEASKPLLSKISAFPCTYTSYSRGQNPSTVILYVISFTKRGVFYSILSSEDLLEPIADLYPSPPDNPATIAPPCTQLGHAAH